MARKRYQKGSVVLRGDVWYGRFWKDEILNGQFKRRYASVRLGTSQDYRTKRLAMRALEPHLSEVNSPLYRARPVATLRQFADRWEKTVLPQLKPSTASNYKCILHKKLLPYFGGLRLDEIMPEVVQQFVTSRQGSARTVRNAVMALRSLWKSAENWGYVKHDPFKGTQLPKSQGAAAKYFSDPDDIAKIINAAPEPFHTLYWLAAETGLRAGELYGLKWQDVENGKVHVRQSVWGGQLQAPKSSGSVRVVAISESLAKHLDALKQEPGQLLFSKDGRPLEPKQVLKKSLHPILAELKMPKMGMHAFRHANASIAHRLGVPLKVVQQRLGHATSELTLNVYTHINNADEQRFASQLGNLFAPESAKLE